jgi:hypothetical protein
MFLILATATAAAAQEPATWRLAEEWRVGGEVEGPHSFLDVRGMDLLTDGRIVLFDARDQQVHFLSTSGQPLRTVGRKGAGPGEYERANGLAVSVRGEVRINDPSTNRFTLLAPNGDLVRTIPITDRWGFSYIWDAFFNDLGLLDEFAAVRREGATESVGARRVWSADFSRIDTILPADCPVRPGEEPGALTYSFRSARGGMTMSIPFAAPRKATLVNRDGSTWSGQYPGYETVVRTPRGRCEPDVTIRLRGRRLPIPSALRDSQVDGVRQNAARYGAPAPDLGRIPSAYPAFEALFVDRSGQLWIERRTSSAARRYEVYSAAGALVAEVAASVAFQGYRPVVITADRVLGFVSDDDGVPHLASFRIVRTP